MRESGGKMAEIKFEAPLATFDECEFHSANPSLSNMKKSIEAKNAGNIINSECYDSDTIYPTKNPNGNALILDNVCIKNTIHLKDHVDNFAEEFAGSLEDLVNTFDEKITKCFGNYEQSVEELAPVQVRSQDEIMNGCQMWWTITGNFGNILPIDWSRTCARQMHVPALQLRSSTSAKSNFNSHDLCSEDEAVANDLDMHALILGSVHIADPIKTADEVIKEIDDIMDESTLEEATIENTILEKGNEYLGSALYQQKLSAFTVAQLNDVLLEMEILIREFSETLISELALRDELEYEKELKNTFISLLLAVQNRRRQYYVEKKKGKCQGAAIPSNISSTDPKYLTTIIPYNMESTPDNQILSILIKILKAINEDSPTVPTLLTDYILKVLCPT